MFLKTFLSLNWIFIYKVKWKTEIITLISTLEKYRKQKEKTGISIFHVSKVLYLLLIREKKEKSMKPSPQQ